MKTSKLTPLQKAKRMAQIKLVWRILEKRKQREEALKLNENINSLNIINPDTENENGNNKPEGHIELPSKKSDNEPIQAKETPKGAG